MAEQSEWSDLARGERENVKSRMKAAGIAARAKVALNDLLILKIVLW